jgi:hypothetical protein
MVIREITGITYTLVKDAENRLVKVHTGNPSQPIAEYTYNGDREMVKAVEGPADGLGAARRPVWVARAAHAHPYYASTHPSPT